MVAFMTCVYWRMVDMMVKVVELSRPVEISSSMTHCKQAGGK